VGGGGIPVVKAPTGETRGVAAVIDKDLAAALLAKSMGADALLLLTDVDAVYADWGRPTAKALRHVSPEQLRGYTFAAGSMGPKVEALCRFVEQTGGIAGTGRLEDAAAILSAQAGTLVKPLDKPIDSSQPSII
jgi:carbamate kinase